MKKQVITEDQLKEIKSMTHELKETLENELDHLNRVIVLLGAEGFHQDGSRADFDVLLLRIVYVIEKFTKFVYPNFVGNLLRSGITKQLKWNDK